jgi:hypothetical protein
MILWDYHQGRSQELKLGGRFWQWDKGGAEGPERGAQRRVGGVWGGSPSPALEVRGITLGKFFKFVIKIRAF